MRKATFVIGMAIGYVLGTRAGRERYEELVNAYHRVADRPGVRFFAGVATERVSQVLGRGGGQAA